MDLTVQRDRYHQLVNDSMISIVNKSYYSSGGCRDQVRIYFAVHAFYRNPRYPQIVACNENLDDSVCSAAQDPCDNGIAYPLLGIYDLYYVPATYPDPYPPDFTDYIMLTMPDLLLELKLTGPWAALMFTITSVLLEMR